MICRNRCPAGTSTDSSRRQTALLRARGACGDFDGGQVQRGHLAHGPFDRPQPSVVQFPDFEAMIACISAIMPAVNALQDDITLFGSVGLAVHQRHVPRPLRRETGQQEMHEASSQNSHQEPPCRLPGQFAVLHVGQQHRHDGQGDQPQRGCLQVAPVEIHQHVEHEKVIERDERRRAEAKQRGHQQGRRRFLAEQVDQRTQRKHGQRQQGDIGGRRQSY